MTIREGYLNLKPPLAAIIVVKNDLSKIFFFYRTVCGIKLVMHKGERV